MFVSRELITRLEKEFKNDTVEVLDFGRTLLINGKNLAIHEFGAAVEMFHRLTEEAKNELFAKVHKVALTLSNEVESIPKAVDTTVNKAAVQVEIKVEEVVAPVEKDIENVVTDTTIPNTTKE